MNSETDKAKELRNKFLLLHVHFLFGSHTVSSFRLVAQLGLAYAHAAMAKRSIEFAALDKPTREQKEDYKLVRGLEKIQADQAEAALDAAGIIYTHAILDALIYKLCAVSMSIDSKAWIPVIQEKKVNFTELQNSDVRSIQQKLLEKYLAQLEYESLLSKCDMLFKIVKPKSTRGILKNFKYSRERLESLDKLRHDLVHKLKFSGKLRQADAKTKYFMNTGKFFMKLLERHYGISMPSEPTPLTSEHPFIKNLLKYTSTELETAAQTQLQALESLRNKMQHNEHPDYQPGLNLKKLKTEITEEQKDLL
jgi:hypothetical protein